MKKFILLILLFLLFSFAARAYAVSTTVTPHVSVSPTSGTNIINEINNLKDRIASKVAQLNLVEKKGIIGVVTDIGDTQLTLSDKDNNIKYIDVDELTKFSSPSAKDNFGISDITKGSTVGVLGRYNKDSRRTLARFIDVLLLPKIISGIVTNIDSANYLLTVRTIEQKDAIIDVETISKTYVSTKDAGLVKSGFSKIQPGERVSIVGFPDKNNKSTIIASRIIRMPDVKPNPRISQNTGVTPSTGNGIKLVPIKK